MVDIQLNAYLDRLKGEEAHLPASQRRPIPTYVELAQESGISPVTLSRITNGHTKQLNLAVLASIVTSMRKRGFTTEIGDLLVYEENRAESALALREMMKPIHEVTSEELKLNQPSARKQLYELREESTLVGTLYWPKALSSTCVAEAADGTWSFTRQGFFNTRVFARDLATEQEVIEYSPNWTGAVGKLKHRDGRDFNLQGTTWWGNSYSLVYKPTQQIDIEMLAVKVHFRLIRGAADVIIKPPLLQTEGASLLTLFGCYLAAMAVEDQNSGMA